MHEITTIYRVEDAFGHGMYSSLISPSMGGKRHPLPEDDCKLAQEWAKIKDKSSFFFGFISLEQLKLWIYKKSWRKELANEGFFVTVYESKNFFFGDTQAVFLKSEAKFIEKLSFHSLQNRKKLK